MRGNPQMLFEKTGKIVFAAEVQLKGDLLGGDVRHPEKLRRPVDKKTVEKRFGEMPVSALNLREKTSRRIFICCARSSTVSKAVQWPEM